MGRPSEYTQETADEICTRLALGESVRQICRDPAMPVRRTVYWWLERNPDFLLHYKRARQAQADSIIDDLLEIVDDEPDPAKARVRMDARKWFAGKMAPKKYGDKLDLNNTHGVTDTLASLMEKIGQNGRRIHDKKPEGEGE